MSLDKRIKSFTQLGKFLNQFDELKEKDESLTELNNLYYDDFSSITQQAKSHNGWFTIESVTASISAIGKTLTEQNLKNWLASYPENSIKKSKTIGVIMAGNIPLVGFHDMMCVLLAGDTLMAKTSSGDRLLPQKIGEILIHLHPEFKNKIIFADKLEKFDAVIATGSNNTARYFQSYFGKYPHIIRKNRNSVAIINPKDTQEDIAPLGKDIFQYYGLGCRNVSKLYLPKGFDFDRFYKAIFQEYQNVTDNNKYANNYDYNKAVYLMGSNKLLDNGFLLLKEDESLTSPVGVLHYEYYNNIEELATLLEKRQEEIQCVVSSKNTPINTLLFGEAQSPQLSDYADGVDTLQFLLDL